MDADEIFRLAKNEDSEAIKRLKELRTRRDSGERIYGDTGADSDDAHEILYKKTGYPPGTRRKLLFC